MVRTTSFLVLVILSLSWAGCASMEYKQSPSYAPEPLPWEMRAK